jgi:hypothetical protein
MSFNGQQMRWGHFPEVGNDLNKELSIYSLVWCDILKFIAKA